MSSVVADLLPLASARGIPIIVESSEQNVRAKVESHFFVLALRNPLKNALDHANDVVTCQVLDWAASRPISAPSRRKHRPTTAI